MELKDIITTGISITAILISVFTLFISHKWNNEGTRKSWEREKKLPFYTKLSIFLDKIDSVYEVAENKTPEKHNYRELMFEANILGLDEIYEALCGLEYLELKIRGERFKKGIQEKTLNDYRDELLNIFMRIEEDRVRLTKN